MLNHVILDSAPAGSTVNSVLLQKSSRALLRATSGNELFDMLVLFVPLVDAFEELRADLASCQQTGPLKPAK